MGRPVRGFLQQCSGTMVAVWSAVGETGWRAVSRSGYISKAEPATDACDAVPYSHPLGYRDIPFSVHGLSLKGPDLVSIANQQIPLEQTLSFFARSLCAKFPTVNVLICLFVLGGWTHTDIELFTLPTQGRSLVSCAFPFRPVCTLPILSPWFNV